MILRVLKDKHEERMKRIARIRIDSGEQEKKEYRSETINPLAGGSLYSFILSSKVTSRLPFRCCTR